MPDLRYNDAAGKPHGLSAHRGRPFLLNVWASWCGPCVEELSEFAQHRNGLQAAGVEVVALNFDGLGNSEASDRSDARRLLKKLDSPFVEAWGSEAVARTLEMGLRFYFDKSGPLPLPCSFLVDPSFRVAVIYLGPVSAEQVVADVGLLPTSPPAWRKAALPFPGRWSDVPFEEPPLATASSQNVPDAPLAAQTETKALVVIPALVLSAIALAAGIFWWRNRSSATDNMRSPPPDQIT
jgi:thiol-disulfide isomerase/thioredoxin